MEERKYVDLLVIGGGVNGTGIAADAAGRGLSVLLTEKNDLASGTSWTSSKLIHGGLRYLEYYEFKLVHEALKEREVLLHKAPHLIQPLEFVLPHNKHLRPAWMIRLGLFLYDHLGKRKLLKKSARIKLQTHLAGAPLKPMYTTGFTYFDCRVDDARLVILNAKTAKDHGAEIHTRTTCVSATREKDTWHATLRGPQGDLHVMAKAIVNAAGPWVADVIHHVVESDAKSAVKWVKGSHMVVPKLYEGNHAYILQCADKRIIFAIPYEFMQPEKNNYTLIGTTDIDYKGDLDHISITPEETTYLCDLINEYFKVPLTPSDVVWSYAGVRPLFDDQSGNPSATTREYHFELEDCQGKLPVLSVFGGKITTYRTLSEHALEKLKPFFPGLKPAWTASSVLPGGDVVSLDACYQAIKTDYPFLAPEQAYRYARSYGSLASVFLKDCHSLADLGEYFGAQLYEKEVRYLIEHEWADDVKGIIWLRSKLGLHLTDTQVARLSEWLLSFLPKQQPL